MYEQKDLYTRIAAQTGVDREDVKKVFHAMSVSGGIDQGPERTYVQFQYVNHHGIMATRRVLPDALEFQRCPGFGYQSGWFLSGECADKHQRRSFALNRIVLDCGMDNASNFHTLFKVNKKGEITK